MQSRPLTTGDFRVSILSLKKCCREREGQMRSDALFRRVKKRGSRTDNSGNFPPIKFTHSGKEIQPLPSFVMPVRRGRPGSPSLPAPFPPSLSLSRTPSEEKGLFAAAQIWAEERRRKGIFVGRAILIFFSRKGFSSSFFGRIKSRANRISLAPLPFGMPMRRGRRRRR